MIALFAILYVVIGALGAAAGGSIVDDIETGRVAAPIGFTLIALGSIFEALAVLALAAWVLR